MMERVDGRELVEFQFAYLLTFLGGREHVEQLARETGAFTRCREIESAADLLQLILIWSAGGQSFNNVAALAAEAGLADVSDVALVKRFAKTERWLAALLGELLADPPDLPRALDVRLIDATTIGRPGSTGTDHRLHLAMNLGTCRITSLELTDVSGGESLERFPAPPGTVDIVDAAYATRSALANRARSGAYFVARFPWSNIPLEHAGGGAFNLLAALRELPDAAPGEFPVRFASPDGGYIDARLVAIRKSEPSAMLARDRVLRGRSRRGGTADMRTLEAAGYTFVLSNLPSDISTANVLELYRFRWQVEMKFKTLKSALHLDAVPARTDTGLRVHVLAKLLVAVLIEYLIENAESFSPWGYAIPPSEQLARHEAPA
jgi:hypothetical protein